MEYEVMVRVALPGKHLQINTRSRREKGEWSLTNERFGSRLCLDQELGRRHTSLADKEGYSVLLFIVSQSLGQMKSLLKKGLRSW